MSSRHSYVLTSLTTDILAGLASNVLSGLPCNVLTRLTSDILGSLDCLASRDIGGRGSLLSVDGLGSVGLFNFEGLVGVVNNLSR